MSESTQTPGEWLDWFDELSSTERLSAAAAILSNSRAAHRCRSEAHDRWLKQQRDALIKIRQVAQEGLQQ